MHSTIINTLKVHILIRNQGLLYNVEKIIFFCLFEKKNVEKITLQICLFARLSNS